MTESHSKDLSPLAVFVVAGKYFNSTGRVYKEGCRDETRHKPAGIWRWSHFFHRPLSCVRRFAPIFALPDFAGEKSRDTSRVARHGAKPVSIFSSSLETPILSGPQDGGSRRKRVGSRSAERHPLCCPILQFQDLTKPPEERIGSTNFSKLICPAPNSTRRA